MLHTNVSDYETFLKKMLSSYRVSGNKFYVRQIEIKVHKVQKILPTTANTILIKLLYSRLRVDTTTSLCFIFIQFVKRRITL